MVDRFARERWDFEGRHRSDVQDRAFTARGFLHSTVQSRVCCEHHAVHVRAVHGENVVDAEVWESSRRAQC